MSDQITCRRCGYKWNYRGTAKRISCSHCKTTITLNKTQVPQPQPLPTARRVPQPEPIPNVVSKHEVVYLPLPLADQLNKFMLSRLIGIAKSEGIDRIKLKINNEGDLYLPP